jgi:hypothetical protein
MLMKIQDGDPSQFIDELVASLIRMREECWQLLSFSCVHSYEVDSLFR